MNEYKKQSLSDYALTSAVPSTLLCPCVTQSVLPFALFTLFYPTPCLAPRKALTCSLLVVHPALPFALCAVRYVICLSLQYDVSCIVLCITFAFSYPSPPCPTLPHITPCHTPFCPILSRPAPYTALSCPVVPCPVLPCPALPCSALPCPALSRTAPCPFLPCHSLPYPAVRSITHHSSPPSALP